MNRVRKAVVLIFLWQITTGGVCFGAATEDALVQFWKAHPDVEGPSSSQRYTAELQRQGVDDPNSLTQFLSSMELRRQVLYSMWLLAPQSKPLQPGAIKQIIPWTTNGSGGFALQTAALRLLLCYYPQEAAVKEFVGGNFGGGGLSQVFWNGGVETRSATLSSETLFLLGEYVDRNTNEYSDAVRLAQEILSIKVASAGGGLAMSVPFDNTNSLSIMLSAMKWPLYESPALAPNCADVFFGYLRNLKSLPSRIPISELTPTIEFLLQRSKASRDDLAKGFVDLCSGDTRLASIVLWSLNESKNNPVATQALDLFNAGDHYCPDISS